MALDDEDQEYRDLKTGVKDTFDNCMEQLRHESSPRKPCFYNRDNHVHSSYMNSMSMQEIDILNQKTQASILMEEMVDLSRY